ncbi:uncharacterized protein BXZ73DRAFT_95489 [Epithele typhae]|uniref:uncharacterized protein n=1 Tax=Epithele typhae TaxID=378194 RepID=UPI002007CBB7|nr:uncharacterized protein BXZ73DRAFT_95489 [Epithele typhae]KAH9945973.1 hypothetical protein BXZ73DRAFT_95489 [Epithele typhae]
MEDDLFPVGSRVFFLEGGKPQFGNVKSVERTEGLDYVVIVREGKKEEVVKLPSHSVHGVTKAR